MRRPQSAREYPSGPITSEVEYVICLTSIICRMIAWYGNCKQGFFAHKRRFTLFQQVKSVDDIKVPLFVSRVVHFQPMNTRLIIHFLSRIVIWLSRFEAWNVMMSLRFDNKKQKNLKTTYVLWGIDDIFRLIAKKHLFAIDTYPGPLSRDRYASSAFSRHGIDLWWIRILYGLGIFVIVHTPVLSFPVLVSDGRSTI